MKKTKEGGTKTIANAESLVEVYTYNSLETSTFASFLCLKFNIRKIINRVKKVYLFELQNAV